MGILAALIAVGIGWAITVGLRGHLAPATAAGTGTATTPPATFGCLDVLDTLPTGSSDIDNLRNASKKAFLAASTPADAMFLKTFAGELDKSGYHDAAECMRKRAAEIEAPEVPLTAAPSSMTAPPPMTPIFPVEGG